MNKDAENLALAIANKTTTRLDVAGLSVETYGPHLGEMYQMIGRAYLADLILKLPSMGELLKHYEYENLEWTTTPPTVEGKYWVYNKVGDIHLCDVYEYKGKLFIPDGYYGDIDLPVEKQEYYSHWLGPLPVPEPPKA